VSGSKAKSLDEWWATNHEEYGSGGAAPSPAEPVQAAARIIGIDDGCCRLDDEPVSSADDFCEAFPAAFLAFHRRDGRRSELTNASRAVLQHLAVTGPVSIGEAARHLDRAQSVVSEIVTQLEGHGLLEREPDPANRRRTLVWLTPAGFARLREDADVLDRRLVAEAMEHLDEATRRGLIDGLDALLRASGRSRT